MNNIFAYLRGILLSLGISLIYAVILNIPLYKSFIIVYSFAWIMFYLANRGE